MGYYSLTKPWFNRVNNQTLDRATLVFDINPQQMKGKSRFLLTLDGVKCKGGAITVGRFN